MNILKISAVIAAIYILAVIILYLLPKPDSFKEITGYNPTLMSQIDCGSILVKNEKGQIISMISPGELTAHFTNPGFQIASSPVDQNLVYDAAISDYFNLGGSKGNALNIISSINNIRRYQFNSHCHNLNSAPLQSILGNLDLIELADILNRLGNGNNTVEMVTSVLVGETGSIEWSQGKYSDYSTELKQSADTTVSPIKIQNKTGSDKKVRYELNNNIIGYVSDKLNKKDIEMAMAKTNVIQRMNFGQLQFQPGTSIIQLQIPKPDLDAAGVTGAVKVDIFMPFVKISDPTLFNCSPNLYAYNYYVLFHGTINGDDLFSIPGYDRNSDPYNKLEFRTQNVTQPVNPIDEVLNITIPIAKDLLIDGLNFTLDIPQPGNDYNSGCPSISGCPLMRREGYVVVRGG